LKDFLTECLHVPDSQIVLLTNEHATRGAILDNFQKHFTTNPRIHKNDAIVLYYAGHGSRVPAPADWPATDGKIETLCPYDERITDENGEEIFGIPDRTINVLLRDLAAKKENNIVRD
jgi:hypothetical protein